MKKWIPHLIMTSALMVLMASCATTKNNKALARVLNNNELTNRAGRVWEKSNPCTIDTIIRFKNGVEIVKYDTLWNDVINTVYDTATRTNTVTDYRTIIKRIEKTDTIQIKQTDLRRLGLANQTVDSLKTVVIQLKNDNSVVKQKLNKRTWTLIIVLVVIGALTFLKIYLK